MILFLFCAAAAVAASLSGVILLRAARRPLDLSDERDRVIEAQRERLQHLRETASDEAAQREAERALLGAAQEGDRGASESPAVEGVPSGAGPVMVAGAVALVAGGFYLALGSPSLPDQPIGARRAALAGASPFSLSPAELLLRLQGEARAAPDQPEGWLRLGRAARLAGDGEMAADAYLRALETGGEQADWLIELADAVTLGDPQKGAAEARRLLSRALELDERAWRAAFSLGMLDLQDGDVAGAKASWEEARRRAGEDAEAQAWMKTQLTRMLQPGGVRAP
ncbi:MAG: c-type cytochrome biogenesis protein CcmI [Pseudomonadota bacterium]